MDVDYMESVLWVFKELYRKGLIYESLKVVAYCNRCQTPLPNFETGLDDSYRIKDDPAVTVAFSSKDDPEISYLAWTTTPWTLPSNLALAVHPDIDYCLVETCNKDKFVLAEDRIDTYAAQLPNHKILKKLRGKTLIGTQYEPLFDFTGNNDNAFRILEGDFADTKTASKRLLLTLWLLP